VVGITFRPLTIHGENCLRFRDSGFTAVIIQKRQTNTNCTHLPIR